MKKIKTFKFEVSNASSSPFSEEDKKKDWYIEGEKKIASPEKIDEIINEYLKEEERASSAVLDSITVTPIDVLFHNNARGNTVVLQYTVIMRNV